ncbi:MAG: hypothetical protein ACREDR_01630 [Blastocatellia bacterium]
MTHESPEPSDTDLRQFRHNARAEPAPGSFNGESCCNHDDRAPVYICPGCSALFCNECAKTVGSFTARVCDVCGSLCIRFGDHRNRQRLAADRRGSFGARDLAIALALPFRHFASTFLLGLVLGAGLFSLPFFHVGIVGLLLAAVGLVPALMATSFMLGCMLQLIGAVEAGRTDNREGYDVVALLADAFDTLVLGAAIVLAVSWPYLLGLVFKLTSQIPAWPFLCWAVLFYPMGLIVAFRTDRFWPTVNPVAGFGAAFEIGKVYLRFLACYLVVVAALGILLRLVALPVLEAGFSFPTYLVLGLVLGPPIFYANVAIACLIGRALFKSGPDVRHKSSFDLSIPT